MRSDHSALSQSAGRRERIASRTRARRDREPVASRLRRAAARREGDPGACDLMTSRRRRTFAAIGGPGGQLRGGDRAPGAPDLNAATFNRSRRADRGARFRRPRGRRGRTRPTRSACSNERRSQARPRRRSTESRSTSPTCLDVSRVRDRHAGDGDRPASPPARPGQRAATHRPRASGAGPEAAAGPPPWRRRGPRRRPPCASPGSSRISVPSSCALASFVPGLSPATT